MAKMDLAVDILGILVSVESNSVESRRDDETVDGASSPHDYTPRCVLELEASNFMSYPEAHTLDIFGPSKAITGLPDSAATEHAISDTTASTDEDYSDDSDWVTDSDDTCSFDSYLFNDDVTGCFCSDRSSEFFCEGWGGECLQEIEDIDFEFVYALHNFVATVEGQANAAKGDTMVLLDDSNSYWWLVRVVKDSTIGRLDYCSAEMGVANVNRLFAR